MLRTLRAPWKLVTWGRLFALGLVLLAVTVGLWVIPSSEYIFLPDPAHPVAPLIKVAGGHVQRDGGGIYYVDIRYRKASLLERLFGGLENGATLYPASEVVPHGLNESQNRRLGQDEMQVSQQAAAAAALQTLGGKIPRKASGAVVVEVEKGLPAAGHLKVHDVIDAVDGARVRTAVDVSKVMAAKRPGSLIHFQVRRNGQSVTVPLRTVPASRGSARGIVGIILNQAGVVFHVQDVGGPSAGLAFALEILQQLGRNVDRGHRIAATGEIWPNGSVHPIGGIKQKTIGARQAGVDAFLVPAGANARDARKYAHGLRIIPVKSFQQALKALATLPEA